MLRGVQVWGPGRNGGEVWTLQVWGGGRGGTGGGVNRAEGKRELCRTALIPHCTNSTLIWLKPDLWFGLRESPLWRVPELSLIPSSLTLPPPQHL